MKQTSRFETRSLTVRMGEQTVLEDISLTAQPGETLGLMGPNGAGKTTLIRTILGVLKPEAGDVLVDGSPSTKRRQVFGYVPQRHEFAWDFPVSVREAVMSGRTKAVGWLRRPGSGDRESVERALADTDLLTLSRRPIGELSGGQKQRVLVARALALQAPILIMDEPFNGVDDTTRELIVNLVDRLRSSGTSILISTHDLGIASSACTRVALLNRRLIGTGTLEELQQPEIWARAYGAGVVHRRFDHSEMSS